ncbi:MAG TPA: hypothetical protein VJT33_03980 [bacterium]|nr:hypothetical protein [bacterium]
MRRFRQRLAQLQQATAAFGEAVTLGQVADGVMEHGCRALGAATTALYAVNDDRTVLDLVAGDSPDLESATTAWPRTPVTNGGPRG